MWHCKDDPKNSETLPKNEKKIFAANNIKTQSEAWQVWTFLFSTISRSLVLTDTINWQDNEKWMWKPTIILTTDCAKKSMKCYRKVFFHLIDLYQHNTGRKDILHVFIMEIPSATPKDFWHTQPPCSGHFPRLIESTETQKNRLRHCKVYGNTTRWDQNKKKGTPGA